MTARPTKPARGMTLLEVLIATTILASLTLIVATLWTQTKQWTDEAADQGSALRLQRALDLLDRQWGARLLDATLPDGQAGVALVDESHLEFITTESVLFPLWPIVKAAYIATPINTGPAGSTPRWRLVYEETRLGTTTPTDAGATGGINLRRSTLVDCAERPVWSAVLTEAQIAELESDAGPASTDPAEPGLPRWINLTEGPDRRWAGLTAATNPESVRLDGITAEGGFQWALVGRPLR